MNKYIAAAVAGLVVAGCAVAPLDRAINRWSTDKGLYVHSRACAADLDFDGLHTCAVMIMTSTASDSVYGPFQLTCDTEQCVDIAGTKSAK